MSSVKSQESRLEGLGYCFSQFVLRCKDNKKHSNGQIFHQKYAAVKDPPPDEGRGHRVLKARITQINTDEYIFVGFVGFVPNFQSKIPDIQRG